MYVLNNNVTYFDSFEVLPEEIKIFIENIYIFKSIVTENIFRIQLYDSITCGYFCTGFINFMLLGKALADFTNLFPRNNFIKNDDINLKYFMANV